MTEVGNLNGDAAATVLVVEDDKPLLEFFCALLRREGYRIVAAANGEEALATAKNHPDERIDILLSDVSMPYMGGIQLAKLLKKFSPAIQVLLISGMPHEEILARCGSSFRPEILPKPFSVSGLSVKLTQLAAAI